MKNITNIPGADKDIGQIDYIEPPGGWRRMICCKPLP
jgi:hypothetical protein